MVEIHLFWECKYTHYSVNNQKP